jgi:hypothetical protein
VAEAVIVPATTPETTADCEAVAVPVVTEVTVAVKMATTVPTGPLTGSLGHDGPLAEVPVETAAVVGALVVAEA